MRPLFILRSFRAAVIPEPISAMVILSVFDRCLPDALRSRHRFCHSNFAPAACRASREISNGNRRGQVHAECAKNQIRFLLQAAVYSNAQICSISHFESLLSMFYIYCGNIFFIVKA
jgi:hypothetical protein